MEKARRLELAPRAVGAVAILCAWTLAGCAQGGAPAGPRAPAVAHPTVPGALLRADRAAHPARGPRPRTPATWLVDPDTPLPHHSPWWPVLAVAQRFARADLSYEVEEVGPAVRSAIAQTCTRAFAAALLSHRASLPPGYSAREVRQRLVGVVALERLAGEAVVLATVLSPGRGGHAGARGAFEMRLVPRPRGWRVAGLTVV